MPIVNSMVVQKKNLLRIDFSFTPLLPAPRHTQKHKAEGHKETFQGFITLIMVRVSQVFACVQTHKTVCIKYVLFLYINFAPVRL